MQLIWRFSTVRTVVSVLAMAGLLVCGTGLILGRVIDRVAERRGADIARAAPDRFRPGLFDDMGFERADERPAAAAIERRALEHDFVLAFYQLLFMLAASFGAPAAVVCWRGWQQRRSEEQIAFLKGHDAATGLMNRAQIMRRLEAAMAAARCSLAVHVVDLDRFKAVIDRLGPAAADALIGIAADRLRAAAGPRDILGRLEGDAFILLQGDLQEPDQASRLAHAVRAALAEPFVLGTETASISASIGVALAPGDATGAVALVHAADTAMRQAKAAGRDTVRLYDPAMDAAFQRRRVIEEAVRAATLNEGFVLHFQPVFDARTETLIGFEALLRLPNPGGDPISPADFIPVAEQMGLINRIGAWVIEAACKAAAAWPDHLMVAVNLSPRQLETDAVCGVVDRALATSGLAARRLELELTESVMMQEATEVVALLTRLKARGLSIAMDDFGTGYSSLSNLWRFPFDKLKIDRSFVAGLDLGDRDMTTMLRTIIALGRSLKLQVTAEGVETAAQAALLRSLDCDQVQGFLYGRPVPERELARIIHAGEHAPRMDPRPRPAYVFKGRFRSFAA